MIIEFQNEHDLGDNCRPIPVDHEGGCEAACPHGCWVEPDGTCPHGNPSWLLKLGLI